MNRKSLLIALLLTVLLQLDHVPFWAARNLNWTDSSAVAALLAMVQTTRYVLSVTTVTSGLYQYEKQFIEPIGDRPMLLLATSVTGASKGAISPAKAQPSEPVANVNL